MQNPTEVFWSLLIVQRPQLEVNSQLEVNLGKTSLNGRRITSFYREIKSEWDLMMTQVFLSLCTHNPKKTSDNIGISPGGKLYKYNQSVKISLCNIEI